MDEAEAIVDYAERPRVGGWSLRSALVRYAQAEPARAGAVLELIRRTDAALKPHVRDLEADPARNAVARSVRSGDQNTETDDDRVIDLLVVALGLDELGDLLAEWAAGADTARPDAAVDEHARAAFSRLSELGVERETRPPRRS